MPIVRGGVKVSAATVAGRQRRSSAAQQSDNGEIEWGQRDSFAGSEEGWAASMRKRSNDSQEHGDDGTGLVDKKGREQLETLGIVSVLPDKSERLMDGVIEKRTLQAGQWAERRLVLTRRNLFIAKLDVLTVSEDIPLHEISMVRRVADDKKMKNAVSNKVVPLTEHAMKLRGLAELDSLALAFEVHTRMDGPTGGRSFLLRADSLDECQRWVDEIEKVKQMAFKDMVLKKQSRAKRFKRWMKHVYDSQWTQGGVAFIILCSYITNIVNAELVPDELSTLDLLFTDIDLGFTLVFAVELAWNMAANWFWPFATDPWNLFDLFVVAISIMSIALSGSGSFNLLRLFRVFRVIRIFRRLKRLKQIINALTASLIPVGNSFLVMGLITSIYAVLGVNILSDRDELHFGKFSASFFTMLQILVGFGETIVVPMWEDSEGFNAVIGAFFMSYIIIAGLVLINIVIAVLLDNFISSVAADNAADQSRMPDNFSHWGNHAGPMDPLIATLVQYSTAFELDARLDAIFEALDVDESQTLSYTEIKYGLSRLNFHPRIVIGEDDFDFITQHKQLCDENEELDLHSFKTLMIMQLEEYTQRKMAHVGESASDSPDHQALFALMMAVRQFGVRMDTMWLEHKAMQSKMLGRPGVGRGRRLGGGRPVVLKTLSGMKARSRRESKASRPSRDAEGLGVPGERRHLAPPVEGVGQEVGQEDGEEGGKRGRAWPEEEGRAREEAKKGAAEEGRRSEPTAEQEEKAQAVTKRSSDADDVSQLLSDWETSRSKDPGPPEKKPHTNGDVLDDMDHAGNGSRHAHPEDPPSYEASTSVPIEPVTELPNQAGPGPGAGDVGWRAPNEAEVPRQEDGPLDVAARPRVQPKPSSAMEHADSLLSDAGTPPPLPWSS